MSENDQQTEWLDDQLIMVSAIQHFSYCPRQWALIHREQVFEENSFTLKGRLIHERADQEDVRTEGDVQILTALPIWSNRLGLTGKCDVVEVRNGIPCPVEYKHGRKKAQLHDELQVCAEAMCLEEMFDVEIPIGIIYHHSSRRRREVELTSELRQAVADILRQIRSWSDREELPAAVNDARCEHCSLHSVCVPQWTNGGVKPSWMTYVNEEL